MHEQIIQKPISVENSSGILGTKSFNSGIIKSDSYQEICFEFI